MPLCLIDGKRAIVVADDLIIVLVDNVARVLLSSRYETHVVQSLIVLH